MTKKAQPRRRYNDEFKAETLQLADKVGVTKAAKELGLHSSQIYQWRAAADKKANTSERETTLTTENAKLKRELAEAKMEVEFLKKAAVDSSIHASAADPRFNCIARCTGLGD